MVDNGDTTLTEEPIYNTTPNQVVNIPIPEDAVTSSGQPPFQKEGFTMVGNNYAMKFKTPEDRKKLQQDYIAYLKQGLPKEYFPPASPATMSRYIKDFPQEFDTDVLEAFDEAERQGISNLMNIGYTGMLGKIDGFKEKTWQFIIQNRSHFKLRTDVTSDDKKMDNVVIYRPTKVEEGSED